jgi:hypothetical protein
MATQIPECKTMLVDSLKYINPLVDRLVTGTYLNTIKVIPGLYGKFYDLSEKGELITELYGENRYIFTVIIGLGAINNNDEYKILTKIIENAKPAHMEGNVVVLEPYIFLNKHSYLGINSVLGQYQNLVLDGQAAIAFTTIS